MSHEAAANSGERRRYFRVDDVATLKYSLVPSQSDLDRRVANLETGLANGFTVTSSLSAITQETHLYLSKVEQTHPLIADYLAALERKIDLLSQAVLSESEDLAEQPTREVNLSAVGMAFRSAQELHPGDLLEIKLLLYPSYTGILTYATVVHCQRQRGDESNFPFRIAVDFAYIRESDRDLLIHHVIKRQHRSLKEERLEREQGET